MRKSFGSSAPSIIYVIVPAWTDDRNKREQLLEKAYRSALRLAVKNDLRSIAFPLLSSGNTRFAQEEAFRIARSVITAVARREELSVYLVLQDHDPFIISHELSMALTSYIAVHEPKQRQMSSAVSRLSEFVLEADEASLDESLEDLLSCRQETFSQKLLSLIDQKDYRDAEVYHRANLDRRHFAKIRSNPAYAPKKNTVLALCIALRLDLQESEDLLRRAGYAFSPCSHADLIVRYFIEHGRYDIFDINEALFYHDLPLLGQ